MTTKDQMGTNGNNETAMVKPKTTAQTVAAWMDNPKMSASLRAALAGYMSVETFAAQCYIAAQNPDLARCSAESLMRAFLDCAMMGLLPGPAHKHVAMVPRNGVITVTPEWRGYKFLMERQDGIHRVRPVLVHVTDEFEVTADGGVHHKYDPFNPARVFEHPDAAKAAKRESGLRGGYLEIKHDTGEVEYHFVPVSKIERNRLCAETQKLWTRWFEEMVAKTIVRDAFSKRIVSIDPQLATRVTLADEADNASLGNDPSRTALPPVTRTERVASLLGAATVAEDVPDMTRAAVANEVHEAVVEESAPTP